MKIVRSLLLIACVSTTVMLGVTEQQTIAQWEKAYRNDMAKGEQSKAMNQLNKLNNRKSPASQAKFKQLWAEFNQDPVVVMLAFQTPDQAAQYFHVQNKLATLRKKADKLEQDIRDYTRKLEMADTQLDALDMQKKRDGKLSKMDEALRKSALEDRSSARRILGIRQQELQKIIEGTGAKKQEHELGIQGWTKRLDEEQYKAENRRIGLVRMPIVVEEPVIMPAAGGAVNQKQVNEAVKLHQEVDTLLMKSIRESIDEYVNALSPEARKKALADEAGFIATFRLANAENAIQAIHKKFKQLLALINKANNDTVNAINAELKMPPTTKQEIVKSLNDFLKDEIFTNPRLALAKKALRELRFGEAIPLTPGDEPDYAEFGFSDELTGLDVRETKGR